MNGVIVNDPWAAAHRNVEEALHITKHDRNDKCGNAEDNFAHIALGWTGALRAEGLLVEGAELSPATVARLMVILKMMRDSHAPHRDNRVDTYGYTLCLDRVEPVGYVAPERGCNTCRTTTTEEDYKVEQIELPLEYEDCVLPRGTVHSDDPRDWVLEERPVIYVAGYFSENPMHGTANAVRAFDELLNAGWLPIVPHTSLVIDMLSPHTPEFWYSYDLGILARCDAMFVCPDALTKRSTGVLKEIDFATRHDIPVYHTVIPAKERYNR